MVQLENVWASIELKPTNEQVKAFMKDRSAYRPWKVLDTRFYVNRFKAWEVWPEGLSYLPSTSPTEMLFRMSWTVKGYVGGWVEFGDYLFGLNRKRELNGGALRICDECDWVVPGGHKPDCSIIAIEMVHFE